MKNNNKQAEEHARTTSIVRRLSGLHNYRSVKRSEPEAKVDVPNYAKKYGWVSSEYTDWLIDGSGKKDTKYLRQYTNGNTWEFVVGGMGAQTVKSLGTSSLYEAQKLRDEALSKMAQDNEK